MRVRFFSPSNELETAQYLKTERQIGEFWQHFRAYEQRRSVEWVARLRSELRVISPGLGLEVETHGDVRRLYILPIEGLEYLPLAEKVAAASESPNWRVATARAPARLDEALARVASTTRFDLKTARLKIGIDRGHALSVVVSHHLFQGNNDDLGGQAAELLVATVAGDALFERWVTSVEVLPAPRPSPLKLVGQDDGALPLPLSELGDTLTTAVSRISDTLPEAPLHEFCERADWVLFEMDELRQGDGDYPLSDLRVATTLSPEMLKSFLSGTPFASERFSRHGERFAFIRFATSGRSQDHNLDLRTALEEALDYALVPGRLGCVVGAGVGETHMYVFLALHSVDAALKLIVRQLQEHQAPKATWVRFCDDEWRLEWVGAYIDTPVPADT